MRAVVCAALVLLAVAATLPDAAVSSGCRLPGARVWEQNEVARLLVRTTPRRPPALYGCMRGQAHARRLAGHVAGVQRGTGKGPVLAGRWALYEAIADSGSNLIRVDLRTGRRRIIDRLYAKYTLHTTDSYVLKPNGSLAWITATSSGPPAEDGTQMIVRLVLIAERGRRIHTVDRASYRVFAEPDPIPDGSLRLSRSGRILRWIQSGRPRSAPIS